MAAPTEIDWTAMERVEREEQERWHARFRTALDKGGKTSFSWSRDDDGPKIGTWVIELLRTTKKPLYILWQDELARSYSFSITSSLYHVLNLEAMAERMGGGEMVKKATLYWHHPKSGSRVFGDAFFGRGRWDISIHRRWGRDADGASTKVVEIECSFQQTREREQRQAALEQHLPVVDVARIAADYI